MSCNMKTRLSDVYSIVISCRWMSLWRCVSSGESAVVESLVLIVLCMRESKGAERTAMGQFSIKISVRWKWLCNCREWQSCIRYFKHTDCLFMASSNMTKRKRNGHMKYTMSHICSNMNQCVFFLFLLYLTEIRRRGDSQGIQKKNTDRLWHILAMLEQCYDWIECAVSLSSTKLLFKSCFLSLSSTIWAVFPDWLSLSDSDLLLKVSLRNTVSKAHRRK